MKNIRPAKIHDIPELLKRYEDDFDTEGFDRAGVDAVPEEGVGTLQQWIEGDNMAVFVGVNDDEEIACVVGGVHAPNPMGRSTIAQVFFWDKFEDCGFLPLKALRVFERWASIVGADTVVVGEVPGLSPDGLGNKLKRLGYELMDKRYAKETE